MNENETEVVVDDDNYDVDLSEFEDLPEEDGEGNQTEPEQQEDCGEKRKKTNYRTGYICSGSGADCRIYKIF